PMMVFSIKLIGAEHQKGYYIMNIVFGILCVVPLLATFWIVVAIYQARSENPESLLVLKDDPDADLSQPPVVIDRDGEWYPVRKKLDTYM
ncbi:MAG TPA: hypothetical protein DHN29_18035, partial [Cytophagales bacterium]|nr:hypothetical protein [Cytophagales bacterium]